MTSKTQNIEAEVARIHSGPVQFGNDWPGSYICARHAERYAGALKKLTDALNINASATDLTTLLELKKLEGIQSTLAQCAPTPEPEVLSIRTELLKLPEQNVRVDTGPVQFSDGSTGVFIRGDNAGFFAFTLKNSIKSILQQMDEDDCESRIELDQILQLQSLLASAVSGTARAMLEMDI